MITAVAAPVMGPSAYLISGAMLVYSALPVKMSPSGTLHNEVVRRIFSSDLQKKLYPSNAFYKGAKVDTGVAEDAVSVEVPQDEEEDAQYVVNPTVYPLQVVGEEDKKKTYDLDLIATKPQLVTDLNQAIVSYDKRAAKLEKHANTLNDQVAQRILQAWQPSDSQFLKVTTGTEARASKLPGTTGNRKRISKADIFHFFSMFNDLNIPMNNEGGGERRLVIPAYMYEDLLAIDEFINGDKLRMRGDLNAGQIGELLGFKVYMRSKTPVYTEAATPVLKPIGAAAAETDNQSCLFFHTQFVRYAEGQNKVYINPDRGEYLGTTMNAKVRVGAMVSRLSSIGVGVLVEDNA